MCCVDTVCLVPVRADGADLGRVRGDANPDPDEQVCGCGGGMHAGLGYTRAEMCNTRTIVSDICKN